MLNLLNNLSDDLEPPTKNRCHATRSLQHFQIFFQNNVVCVVEISQDEDEDTEFEINVQKSPKNIQIWIDVGKVKS